MVTLLVPAQQMMLWCGMMNMDSDTEMMMNHEAMAMNMSHHDKSMSDEHCGSASDKSMNDSEDCDSDMMIDCNCVTVQGTTSDQAVFALVSVQVPTVTESELFDLINPEIVTQIPTPPPIWSFSSYSPPDLFLANASFLI